MCQLAGKRVVVTCSEIDVPGIVHCEAGGMALAAYQISVSLGEHLGMRVRLLVPAVSVVPIDASWRACLPLESLLKFKFCDGEVAWFQIFVKFVPDLKAPLELLAITEVMSSGEPKNPSDQTTYFRQFPDFNFRIPANRQRGAELYGVEPIAQLLKPAALVVWNDVLAQALMQLETPDAIMFSNYADNRLPELLEFYDRGQKKHQRTALIHMIHAELGDPQEGLASENRPARSVEYPPESPFAWFVDAVRRSNVTLINPGYAGFLSDRYKRFYGSDNPASPLLHELADRQDSLPPMHLGISNFDPRSSEPSEQFVIPDAQFVPLSANIPGDFGAITPEFVDAVSVFKRKNKAILYAMIRQLPQQESWKNGENVCIGRLNTLMTSKLFVNFDRIDPTKGTLWLLDIIPLILELDPEAQFIIASGFTKMPELSGTPFYRQALRLAADYMGRFVLLLGQPDRKVLYAGADFTIKPSVQETYGLGPLEGMSTGAIVLGYDDHAYSTIMEKRRCVLISKLDAEDVDACVEHANANLAHVAEWRVPPRESDRVNYVNDVLSNAVQTALAMSEDERARMAAHCIVYVVNEHNWQEIMHRRFGPRIEQALSCC